MNFFSMKGAWNWRMAFWFDLIVAQHEGALYENLAEFLESPAPGSAILDVGCGGGQATISVARRYPSCSVKGVDLSKPQIARAKKRGRSISNVSFEIQDATAMSLPDESFDIVYSTASVKHWPDPARGVSEMKRVCKKKGTVIVVEVDKETTRADAKNFVSTWLVLPPFRPLMAEYFRHFVAGQGLTLSELTAIVKASGLANVEGRKIPGQPLNLAMGKKA